MEVATDIKRGHKQNHRKAKLKCIGLKVFSVGERRM